MAGQVNCPEEAKFDRLLRRRRESGALGRPAGGDVENPADICWFDQGGGLLHQLLDSSVPEDRAPCSPPTRTVGG